MKSYLGIDNGVSGAIAFLVPGKKAYVRPMPIVKTLNYTKKKAFVNRVDVQKLQALLAVCKDETPELFALIERPMVNPKRFPATLSAIRCLEATLIAFESEGVPYQFIDSKEWQKTQLPKGLKGEELKFASLEMGKRLWPYLDLKKDADSLLIARHAQQKNL